MPIRFATEDDVPSIHACHDAAILEKAASFYSPEILDAWMSKQNNAAIERDKRVLQRDDFFCIVYEESEEIFGFGMIDFAKNYMQAIYARKGASQPVGQLIFQELKKFSKSRGCSQLDFDASTNSRSFYERNGAIVLEEGTHTLRDGVVMPCVKMRLTL